MADLPFPPGVIPYDPYAKKPDDLAMPPGVVDVTPKQATPPPSPASLGDYGRGIATSVIQGAPRAIDMALDPLAFVRNLISPGMERLEQNTGSAEFLTRPPTAEGGTIGYKMPLPAPEETGNKQWWGQRPGEAISNAIFGTTDFKPYEPQSGLGRVGMDVVRGASAGWPAGLPGVVVGAIGGLTGGLAREGTKQFGPGVSERAETAASMIPGGALTALGARTHSRTGPQMETAGVNPTFGQAMGGPLNTLEQAWSSIPIAGDFMKSGRAGAVEDFNRGGINRALGHVGARLDDDAPLGRPTLGAAHGIVGDMYNTIEPHLTIPGFDNFYQRGVGQLHRDAAMLPQARRDQLHNIINEQITGRLDANGRLTGAAFRAAEENLGDLARNYRNSGDADQRGLGRLVEQLQGQLRGQLRRSNPDYADELSRIHRAFAELLRIETASVKPGSGLGGQSEYGVFTPTKLGETAFELEGSRARKASGKALMQDYAEQGRRLLGDSVPDSGTAYRSLAALMASMGVGGIGSGFGYVDPITLATAGAGITGAGLLYSDKGRAAMNYFLRRPEQAAVGGLLAGQDDR